MNHMLRKFMIHNIHIRYPIKNAKTGDSTMKNFVSFRRLWSF